MNAKKLMAAAFGGVRTEGQICYGPALTDPSDLLLMLK